MLCGVSQMVWFVQVTGSDDKTWKMWHLPKGDLIMSGEGHTDWLAGVAFHPKVVPVAVAYLLCRLSSPFPFALPDYLKSLDTLLPPVSGFVTSVLPLPCLHTSR